MVAVGTHGDVDRACVRGGRRVGGRRLGLDEAEGALDLDDRAERPTPVLSFQSPLLISTKCSMPPALFGSPPATHQLEYEKGSPVVQTKLPSCATSVSPIQNGPVMMLAEGRPDPRVLGVVTDRDEVAAERPCLGLRCGPARRREQEVVVPVRGIDDRPGRDERVRAIRYGEQREDHGDRERGARRAREIVIWRSSRGTERIE